MNKNIYLSSPVNRISANIRWMGRLIVISVVLSCCIVFTAQAQLTITKYVAASSDDAEQQGPTGTSPGAVNLISNDLEMVNDMQSPAAGTQTVGIRFQGINIPQGAVITSAYITFTAVAADYPMINSDTNTFLNIKGEAADNAPTFSTATNNISGRAMTAASVGWNPTDWITGSKYNTPSIAAVVQEIVNRSGWISGNSMSFIISGTGHRSAASWDDVTSGNQPKLVINYTTLHLNTTVTNVLCHGNSNGAITLTVSGGIAPYSFDWSNNGLLGYTDPQNLTNVPAGSYVVKVRDNVGATAETYATILQPGAALSLATTVSDVTSPGGSDGAVDLTVTGGTYPYSFLWSNSGTTEDISGVSSGTYTVTVTDGNGCSATTSATVATISNPSSVTKYLYLSDPSSSLDRVDPVATNDITTAKSPSLYTTPRVIIDATSSFTVLYTGGKVFKFSHTTGVDNNRLMLIGVSWRDGNAPDSVKYGGVPLSLVGVNTANGNAKVAIYKLLNPNSGSAIVTVSFPTAPSNGAVIGVMTFAGVNQTTPLGTFNSAKNTTAGPATVNIASASGDLVFSTAALQTKLFVSPGGGATSRWNIATSGDMRGAGSTLLATSGTTTMSWTLSGKEDWCIAGVAIKPAAANTNTTFTQNPVLCQDLVVKAGLISVETFVDIMDGTMPSNPNISASLKYGANTIANLVNPAYNSSTGALSWSTTLGSDVLIPAGSAITLTINTSQAGVAFNINYDSKTKPSKLSFLTSTYIKVNSIKVFDAPYSAGNEVTSLYTNNNYYVRVDVSDPFGSSDINGVTLIGTRPDNSVHYINMGPSMVVSTPTCSKIYEYAWPGPQLVGTWHIQAIAHEGTEGVVYSTAIDIPSYLRGCRLKQNRYT